MTVNAKLTIYVDLDDVLCMTAEGLVDLVFQRTGKRVDYEGIFSFDLADSFRLTESEHSSLMEEAHGDLHLCQLKPVPLAVESLQHLNRLGVNIHIVTGRPPESFNASKRWLNMSAIPYKSLTFVDKYGRWRNRVFAPDCLSLDNFDIHQFAIAVEDAPCMVEYLLRFSSSTVLMFDRPWNQKYIPPNEQYSRLKRCKGWAEISHAISTATRTAC